MSDQPDWMNFGEEDHTLASPTNNDAFTVAVAATAADTTRSGITHHDEDIPLFLREDAAALRTSVAGTGSPAGAHASATPAFLSDMDAQGGQATSSCGPNGGAVPSAAALQSMTFEAEERKKAASSTAVMYADQPSAAVLRFSGDSGDAWVLHRVRILGKGNYGCATLYSLDASSTTSPSPTRAVVVKDINVQTMLNPSEDLPAVQTELRVLRSAAGHPNLVQYVDALFDTRPATYPMCFIVMEYAAGGDLSALLERCAASSPSLPIVASPLGGGNIIAEDSLAAYLIQTAVALHSLHTEHGILHRDVKPHNIFLLEDGATVRLGDFGISTQLGRVGEKAKEACGSPYFMAPEIFEERPYDSGADVWSLGVVFYQLMAQQLPFTASSVAALAAQVRRGHVARLSEATESPAAAYSKELRELVDALLTVDPAARPTLRRVLRSRYIREHLRHVPASVLQAKRPVVARVASAGPQGERRVGGAATPHFADEALYVSLFGSEAVAEAVAHGSSPGVSPIVNRISHTPC